ncbi:MAG: glycosyltransferase family 4 protein [Pseudomonadota bacterium]
MTTSRRIAFFAPIKPPDHPIPSGDRLIAQNLITAFEAGGHTIELASRYICYSKRSNPEILEERKTGALEEAESLKSKYLEMSSTERPDIWVTYHPYCKAPDWIGPVVSKALRIPYVTIEAARTGQGGPEDEWGPWRREAQVGIRQADLHLVFKPTDRKYLTELLGSEQRLFDIPTFMDTDLSTKASIELPTGWKPHTPVMTTTGMMRKGKKDRNFYMLAEILSGMTDQDWNLVVVGGGPEETQIRAAFAEIPTDRIHWTSQVPHEDVLAWMAKSDLFIWPGWKEPIGMVYLEAQLMGLPVIAYESMGVPLVVEHSVTGLLAPEDDVEAIRRNITVLLQNPKKRKKMGEIAPRRVQEKHSIKAAASILSKAICNL